MLVRPDPASNAHVILPYRITAQFIMLRSVMTVKWHSGPKTETQLMPSDKHWWWIVLHFSLPCPVLTLERAHLTELGDHGSYQSKQQLEEAPPRGLTLILVGFLQSLERCLRHREANPTSEQSVGQASITCIARQRPQEAKQPAARVRVTARVHTAPAAVKERKCD